MKHALKYAFFTVLGLMGYLLLMKSTGNIHNYYLRFFNLAIIAIGVYKSVDALFKNDQQNFNYLSGIGIGVMTSIFIAVLFTTSASTYLLLDATFLLEIQNTEAQGEFFTEVTTPILIFIESFAFSLLCTFASMQWLKQR